MTTWTLREEIAKERFLDMMAAGDRADGGNRYHSGMTADAAVAQADALMAALVARPAAISPKTKGCPECFGSGGKRGNPCSRCVGSGRVPA